MTTSIRDTFVSRYGPDEGFLVEFDFTQLEICALAEVANDTVLIEELNRGEDIHRLNAAMWLMKPSSSVTTDERKRAKVMTFQLQYGARAPKMAASLGIPESEAQAFIDSFYKKYQGIKAYHDKLEADRKANTQSSKRQADPSKEMWIMDPTPTGRMYAIPFRQAEGSKNWYYSSTEMKNYPIQGFGTADIVPIVINLVYDKIELMYNSLKEATKPLIINTVHDSIMFDCKAGELYTLFECVEMAFYNFPDKFKELFDYELKVRYNYDVKFGKNWSDKDMTKLSRNEVQSIVKEMD